MSYDSPHWQWGPGICNKHRGQSLPCKACIEAGDPDLTGEPTAQAEPKTTIVVNNTVGKVAYEQLMNPALGEPYVMTKARSEGKSVSETRDEAMSLTFGRLYSQAKIIEEDKKIGQKVADAVLKNQVNIPIGTAPDVKVISLGESMIGMQMLSTDHIRGSDNGVFSSQALEACLRRSWIMSVIEVIEFHIPPDQRDRTRPPQNREGKRWQRGPWEQAETWAGMLTLLKAELPAVVEDESASFKRMSRPFRFQDEESRSYRSDGPSFQNIAKPIVPTSAKNRKRTSDSLVQYAMLTQWKMEDSWDLYNQLPAPARRILDDFLRTKTDAVRGSVLIRAASLHVRHVKIDLDLMPINPWEKSTILELKRMLSDADSEDCRRSTASGHEADAGTPGHVHQE